jgi:hypothetical protein
MTAAIFSRAGIKAAAVAVTAAATVTGAAAIALAGPAGASTGAVSASSGYNFTTINNHRDVTFNQLLGINSAGLISGYFGSGMPPTTHPNKGYTVHLPYNQRDYRNENFPGSKQTQVTGLNDLGNTVGFWVNGKGANFGFYTSTNHKFHQVDFPGAANASPQVDQLLGINDHGLAVGFFTNSLANNRGYEYDIHTGKYSRVLKPGSGTGKHALSLTATGINNFNTVTGFYVNGSGTTVSFVKSGSHFLTFARHGAAMTQAFGINDSDVVAGTYTIGTGSSAKTYGFTWTKAHGFKTVNDPHGIGSTVINGLNDRGELVGFYTDSKGNTDGLLARPRS